MDFNWDKCTGGAYRSINKQLKLHRFDSTMPWAQAVTTKNSPKLLQPSKAFNNQLEYNCFCPPPVAPHQQKMDTQVRVMISPGVA